MLEFIISNYMIFVVIALVLLLGLFGYIMDKKKYVQYRNEILNEDKALATLSSEPDVQNVATPVSIDNNVVYDQQSMVTPIDVNNNIPEAQNIDPMTGSGNQVTQNIDPMTGNIQQ